MGTQILDPGDSIQNAIDSSQAGPGGEIRLTPGTYSQQAVFRYSNANNNGTFGNNLRIIIEPGAVWQAPNTTNEPVRMDSARYVTFEGGGTIKAHSGTRGPGGIHMFGNAGQRRTNIGHIFRNLTVVKTGGPDAIKHSEAVGVTMEDLTVIGDSGATGVEELIDFNKGGLASVRRITVGGRCHKAFAFKGGFVGATVDDVSGDVTGNGIEIGGYPGSGEWAWLVDEFNNGISQFVNDPWLEELAAQFSRYSNSPAFEWSCREIYITNWNVAASNNRYRFIAAYDSRISTGPGAAGSIPSYDTLFTSNRNGAFYCHNLWIDGTREFPVRAGRDTPTPYSVTPAPGGTDPTPPPTPSIPVLASNTVGVTVNVP